MFKTIYFSMVVSTASTLLLLSSTAFAQPAADATSVVRVYDVTDLVEPQSNLLDDWLTGDSKAPVTGLRRSGLGSGLMGGGMGAMGGGGGFFAIPSHIQPQFGGGGESGMGGIGGGGMGGMGGGMSGMGGGDMGGMGMIPAHRELTPAQRRMDDLIDILNQLQIGGANVTNFGNLLIASTNEAGHQQIEALLKSLRDKSRATPTMEIALRLVKLSGESTNTPAELTSEQLKELAGAKDAISVTVRCGNGREGVIASGARKSFVISAVPVVGSDGSAASPPERSIGYSPRVITPMIGLIGKVRPLLNEASQGPRSARIDLGIVYSVGSDEVTSATFGTGQTIDRIDISAAEFESQLNVVESQWTLAGLTSMTDGLGSNDGLLAVIVRWEEPK